MTHTPLMFVLSSPSGAGKSTMSNMLLDVDATISLSISATTRTPREGEVDGKHYYFVDRVKFEALIKEGAFLEYAEVHGNLYGTLRREVDRVFAQGCDVLFDIDYQGTQQIASQDKGGLVSIFLLPPSMDSLEERLTKRGLDSAEVVAKRMAKARDEISHWAEYDYVLINDDKDKCFAQIRKILEVERMKRARQPQLLDVIRSLMAD